MLGFYILNPGKNKYFGIQITDCQLPIAGFFFVKVSREKPKLVV